MSACRTFMATQRSSVSSNARYTVDMPPEPIFSSKRKRLHRSVPITARVSWRDRGRIGPLLHRSGLSDELGERAERAQAGRRVRRLAGLEARHGRARARLQGTRERRSDGLGGGGGCDRDADGPAAVEGKSDLFE